MDLIDNRLIDEISGIVKGHKDPRWETQGARRGWKVTRLQRVG